MENEMIYNVDIADFKVMSDKLEYLDENVMVSQTIEGLPKEHTRGANMVRIKFFMIVNCIKGSMKIEINGTTYHLQEKGVLFVLPTMVLSNVELSSDYEIRFIGFATNFLHNVLRKDRGTEKVIYNVYKNPIFHIDTNEDLFLVHYYSTIVMKKIKETTNRYRKEILHSLFSAMFCEMMNELLNRVDEVGEVPDRVFRRAGYVFKNFIDEVSKDGGVNRSVAYFADLLCYSPKYVSSVVKQVSGRTALDWINEYAIQQIKIQLKHSDKSIKEIADMFNFSNQSFFGKYVKKHLGVSPARYRHMSEE